MTGQWSIVAKNACATKTENVKVVIEDKPGAPEGPITYSTITSERITLNWKEPKSDGNLPITGYVVEKRETSRIAWSAIGEERTTSCTARKLINGHEYQFRVMAINANGQGRPIHSDP